jgi:hypothetical protein
MAGALRASAIRSYPRLEPQFFTVDSMKRIRLLFLGAIITAVGCLPSKEQRERKIAADSARADSINVARQDLVNRASPGYVIDSILPVEETIRRFRAAVGGEPVTEFAGASRSRETLVRRFMKALTAGDSADLRAMALNAREFADLVYPESPYTHPPYRQSPALVWNQIQNPSASGFTRLVRRLGNQPLRYVNHKCDVDPDRQGSNLIWTNCFVRLRSPNEPAASHRLFGSIIERDGNFKIVSYRNQF